MVTQSVAPDTKTGTTPNPEARPPYGSAVTRVITKARVNPWIGLGLFAYAFAAQLGHLIEHIALAVRGSGLLGPSFDSEESHLLFNGLIALLSLFLVAVFPRNAWVYVLLAISLLHQVEHIFIYIQYALTGSSGGPGVLGINGALGVLPLDRVELHNAYNGAEMILLTLGLLHESEARLETA